MQETNKYKIIAAGIKHAHLSFKETRTPQKQHIRLIKSKYPQVANLNGSYQHNWMKIHQVASNAHTKNRHYRQNGSSCR